MRKKFAEKGVRQGEIMQEVATRVATPRVTAIMTTAIALGGLNPSAMATVVQTTSVKISTLFGVADFGSGNHSFGDPSGSGTVTFDYAAPNGQLVCTARVTGTLYWDALASGCARLIIEFKDLNGNILQTQNVNTQCPAPGFNANAAANQAPVDNVFASANLHSVTLRTAQVNGATVTTIGTRTVTAPRTRNFFVIINNNESDFGGGTQHSFGAPVSGGTISFTRTNGVMAASVTGTLFWDSINIFGSGVSRVRIDFQDLPGTNLTATQTFDLEGSGCCATDAKNQLPVGSAPFSAGSLWRVRLRVGQVSGGNNTGVVSRLVDFNGVGTAELTPSDASVVVDERLNYALAWTVPESDPKIEAESDPLNWHDLKSVELRIRDGGDNAIWVRFDEASNTLSLFDDASGQFGTGAEPGSAAILETKEAILHVAESSVEADSATSPTVKLNLSMSLKAQAAGRAFIVEAAADDDIGNRDEFAQVGTLRVKPGAVVPDAQADASSDDAAASPDAPAAPEAPPPVPSLLGNGMCGASAASMLPLAMLGLGLMKRSRPRRGACDTRPRPSEGK